MKTLIPQTLSGKIILYILVIFAGFIVFFNFFAYQSLQSKLEKELNTLADTELIRMEHDLQLPLWELDKEWIDQIILTEMRNEQVDAVFVEGEEGIFAAKRRDDHGKIIDIVHDHLNGDLVMRSGTITHKEATIGRIILYFSKTKMKNQLREEFLRAAVMAVFSAAVITFLLGWMLKSLIIYPLKQLNESTHHIAEGEYDWPIPLDSNDEIGMLGRSIDVMQNKIQKREAELRKSIGELDRFFTVTLDMLCIADMEGNLLRLNNAWETVLGYPLQEIYTHTFFDFIHPDDMAATLKAVETLDSQSSVIGFVNRYRCRDGSYRSLMWQSVPVGAVIYAAAHDITDLLRQQQALKETNETLELKVTERTHELVEANKKLQELDKLKSMFIASMSHELRTPLNSIIGFAGVMLQGLSGPLNEKQTDQLKRVKSAGKHLLSLISDVIDISKIEAGRVMASPEPFKLNDLIQEAYGEIEILAKPKELTLELELIPEIEMFTDKKRLYQCILNYLSNAVKFTESGGVTLGVMDEGETIRIWVKDTGIGIDEADKPRLFEAFERLETHLRVLPGGTGLGLYLTRKITESVLQGTVWVESKAGEGSVFGLRIPKQITVEGK
ncbi:MAG: ATP-binding protein [Sulfuricurvum sp.]|nr:ATP-binding protein [Sulfuricurvum sp.]